MFEPILSDIFSPQRKKMYYLDRGKIVSLSFDWIESFFSLIGGKKAIATTKIRQQHGYQFPSVRQDLYQQSGLLFEFFIVD